MLDSRKVLPRLPQIKLRNIDQGLTPIFRIQIGMITWLETRLHNGKTAWVFVVEAIK